MKQPFGAGPGPSPGLRFLFLLILVLRESLSGGSCSLSLSMAYVFEDKIQEVKALYQLEENQSQDQRGNQGRCRARLAQALMKRSPLLPFDLDHANLDDWVQSGP